MAEENATTTGVQTDDSGAAPADTILTGATDDTGSDTAAAAAVDDATADTAAAAAADADGDPAAEAAGDKTAEGDNSPPEAYADFTVPDGMQLDETALSEAAPIFKELGLTQEQAQKVVDLHAKQIQASELKTIETFNQLTTEWRTAAENDKEYGGDKFDENVKIAQKAVDKFGNPKLKQLMTDHGIGNHPEMIRFMVKVGHTLKEDVPGSTGSMSTKAKDAVSILYPNDS